MYRPPPPPLSPLNLYYGFFKKSIKVRVSQECYMLIEMLVYIKN